jgi:hypothetical protein
MKLRELMYGVTAALLLSASRAHVLHPHPWRSAPI